MLLISFITALCFLIVLSAIDFLTFNKKGGAIPSALTTIFLIVMFIVSFPNSLYIGILAGLIALLQTDFELYLGIADFKIFVASAMAFPNIFSMLIFAVCVSIVAVAIKTFIFYKITSKKNYKFPFIPVILVAFVIAFAIIEVIA